MKRQLFFLSTALAAFFIFSACQELDYGKIVTVNGIIKQEQIGLTLSHEHLLVDFIGADSIAYERWDRHKVLNTLLPYLAELKKHDVHTFIDATPAFLGRDPELLKMIAEKSGMNIITNTGYYGAHSNKFIPKVAFDMSASELADIWINEYNNGIEGTKIRPGFIKIAVDPVDTLSAFQKKLVQASALTQIATGMVIASHTGPDAPAFSQIEILQANNVPLSSFIWVHAGRGTVMGNIKAAKMGAWISLDNYNPQKDENPGSRNSSDWYAERLSALKEAGVWDHILISQDAGWYRPGEVNGGNIREFTGIFTNLIPTLINEGFSQSEIEQLLITNPMKAFAIRKLKSQ